METTLRITLTVPNICEAAVIIQELTARAFCEVATATIGEPKRYSVLGSELIGTFQQTPGKLGECA